MGSRAEKKVRLISECECEGDDRISRLPDDLIHKIYSSLDIKEAVQASVLSKRWKLIWTTLPFISFRPYGDSPYPDLFPSYNTSKYAMFIRHVFCNRNHQSSVSELKLYVPKKLTVHQSVSRKRFRGCVIEKFIQYAIKHNVECLDIGFRYPNKVYKLSTFSSNSLKKLTLDIPLKICPVESDCWDLPALTTLHLKGCLRSCKLPESWLTSLPALRTLQLNHWDLSETSYSLPNLTTLHMVYCRLAQMVWDLPAALLNLHLDIRGIPKNMSDMFSTLASLKNLTLVLYNSSQQEDLFISCPQLLNLDIRSNSHAYRGTIVVSAPQLCNFSTFGIFLITFKVAELENVDIKLKGWRCENMKIYHEWFTYMLSGLGTAKNISFDLESIEALAKKSDFLASCSSPFYNLKYVKLPKEYIESSIPSALRSYLLSGSRGATIVTSLPRKNRILQTRPVSVAAENVVSSDRVSSSEGNRDIGLWQGHEVNSEFVCLLDHIMHKYPGTFEHFTTKSKKLCTMNLNMLCTSVNDFTKKSLIEVDSEMIVEYRDLFTYLQNQGLNVSWLVKRLNYIKDLRFSKPLIPELHAINCDIDDARSKLKDLQALRMAKISEIQNDFGTMGTSIAVGFIGDDLLPGP